MKVYIVMEDNGERWEDYVEYLCGVYSTHEKAVEFIESEGYEEDNGVWSKNPHPIYAGGFTITDDAWIVEREIDVAVKGVDA